KALFKIALEKRDFEITQLVQRNNFFMIFQGVLFAGVMQSSHTKPVVTLLVCIAGLLISLFQVGMASGAKFWQEYWEEALKKIEGRLLLHIHRTDDSRREIWSLFHDRTAIYDEIVNRRLHSHNKSFMSITSWLVAKRFSVSRIPIYVGLSLSIIWAVMVFIAVDIDFTGINVQVKGFN
ncbi:RipA family octameric membrane protein, partial [Marinobacterium weihaiense]